MIAPKTPIKMMINHVDKILQKVGRSSFFVDPTLRTTVGAL